MPGFDGRGPNGQGSMTGGGRGYCAMPVGQQQRPYAGNFFGRGRGFRQGNGLRGFGRNRYISFNQAAVPSQDELEVLKKEAQLLKQQLADMESYISGLEKK